MVIIHRVVLYVSTGVILPFEKLILRYKGVQSIYSLDKRGYYHKNELAGSQLYW